ncbi:hypothetical protein P691DRAFT_667831 [Macrolepiota fuliginosa MF-IS2]|uniref:Uncharacterized protein n=1 Tax=Macrolepiota fuliginosa MF-IS2 TaxID=1400762 RepID=A0A9P5XGS7_9AGAR|nr:hypothetical protein P691DRAFT_667831 [Macrolepiota fuliginosa MF-IS2]
MTTTPTIHLTSQNVTLPPIHELFNPHFLDVLLPDGSKNTSERNVARREPRDFSVNSDTGGRAIGSAGPIQFAILDVFNGCNVRTPDALHKLEAGLRSAWAEDSERTLRLIWSIRSIHDGRGEKELFYSAFGWLYDNHPRTAISNLRMLVTPVCVVSGGDVAPHGYWKDLLNILALATCDELTDFSLRKSNFLHTYTSTPPKDSLPFDRQRATTLRKERRHVFHEQLAAKLEASNKFRALYIAVARLFAEQLRGDIRILSELQDLDEKDNKEHYRALVRSISLAGKWAPTPGGSHDRVTNIATAICQLLFSPNENSGPDSIGPLPSTATHPIPTNQHNCTILRNYYHHWILRPLREILACPEPLMSAKKWKEIQYSRVPSLCMSRNKPYFILHDPEGFQLYLAGVESRKKMATHATAMPHELIAEAIELQEAMDASQEEAYPRVAEHKRILAQARLGVINAQWHTMISKLKEGGNWDRALAICGVSGSAGSIYEYNRHNVNPIFPSIALSLLVASVTKYPFNTGLVTFSNAPEFVRLERLGQMALADMVDEVLKKDLGGNIDLQAVFLEQILPLAKESSIAKEDMIKRVFIFSDMQFDHAAGMTTGPWWLNRASESEMADRWEVTYKLIEGAFMEAGYDVPEIVFWNLAGEETVRQTVEVEAERRGVVMMSGFSSSMMKAFMGEVDGDEEEDASSVATEEDSEEEDETTPLSIMQKALLKNSYDGLAVLD